MSAIATLERSTPQSTSTASTELDAVVSNLPWGDGFDFTKGLDAITGGLMHSALERATPVERTVRSTAEHIRFIQNESELNTEIETAVSGKYNIEGVTVSAAAQYLQKIQFSELAVTLIASYTSEYEGYDEIQRPQLTADAQKLINEPAKFRKQHGDYFIRGGKRGSSFHAVYTCRSRSAKDMVEFKASVGAEVPDVFSAEGSARFMKASSTHNVSVAVDLWMYGHEGSPPSGPWTPEKIIKTLEWFKGHEKGRDNRAELVHYSALDADYPRTIDVSPDVFVALKRLYAMVWDIRARYASCPPAYQKRFTNAYNDLVNGVTANQSRLPTDLVERAKYQQQAEALQAALNQVFERMDFYIKVREAVSTEPRKDQEIDDSGRQSYLYGYSTYTKSNAVVINTDRYTYKEDWQVGWREHTFDWQHTDRLIVGWEVVSNWHDGTNGWWEKKSDPILLTHRAEVHVKSLYDRGCNWSFNVFWVDAKDYEL
jgi:hypothetical protein